MGRKNEFKLFVSLKLSNVKKSRSYLKFLLQFWDFSIAQNNLTKVNVNMMVKKVKV